MSGVLLFVSGSEIFIILIFVLLLFGSKKLPELARGLGKGMQEFKKATAELKKELEDSQIVDEVKNIKKDISENPIVNNLNKDINEIKNNLNG